MSALERDLRALCDELVFPPMPELAAPVRARLAEPRPRRTWLPARRPLAIALAVLVVALGAALAVPPARTAILELLGLRGVEIRFVEKLPEGELLRGEFVLGEPVTLEEARRREPLTAVPTLEGLGEPDAVYYEDFEPPGQVTLVWGDPERPRLLLSLFRGEAVYEKVLTPGSTAEPVMVDGEFGVWIEGQPHGLIYRSPDGTDVREAEPRLAGNTLVWQRGLLTLRLEGEVSRDDALRIARSLGPGTPSGS